MQDRNYGRKNNTFVCLRSVTMSNPEHLGPIVREERLSLCPPSLIVQSIKETESDRLKGQRYTNLLIFNKLMDRIITGKKKQMPKKVARFESLHTVLARKVVVGCSHFRQKKIIFRNDEWDLIVCDKA